MFAGLYNEISQGCSVLTPIIEWPEHPYPAALADALASYRWLLEQGYFGEQIILAGFSRWWSCHGTYHVFKRSQYATSVCIVAMSPWMI